MSQTLQNWTITLRGDHKVVEVILKDRDGVRASRTCSNLDEIEALLYGWERQFGCDTYILYITALQIAPEEIHNSITDQSFGSFLNYDLKPLSPETTKRILVLSSNPYRPKEITELKRKIENETRVAEFILANTGAVDEGQIDHIVRLKLQLDATYTSWAEGEIN